MSYTYNGLEIEDNGKHYYCSGSVEFEYEAGEPDHKPASGGGTPGYAASAKKISAILDEASDIEGEDIKDPKELEEVRLCVEAHFQDNQSELVESWESDAMELAASNRADELEDRRRYG